MKDRLYQIRIQSDRPYPRFETIRAASPAAALEWFEEHLATSPASYPAGLDYELSVTDAFDLPENYDVKS